MKVKLIDIIDSAIRQKKRKTFAPTAENAETKIQQNK